MSSTRATEKHEGGLYMTAVITATAIQVKTFNHSGLQSVSHLLKGGTEEISSMR
jgi:hypothetical protein